MAEKLRWSQQKLSQTREKLSPLLDDLPPFIQVEYLIRDYVFLLGVPKIHQTKSEVLEDLRILEDLLPKLENQHGEAKQKDLQEQLSSVYAHRRNSMMLRQLHVMLGKETGIPKEFRKWIGLQLCDMEWVEILESTYEQEKELIEKAKAYRVPLEPQTITTEPLDVHNPESVINCFTKFREEFTEIIAKTAEISCARTRIPPMRQSVKELVSFLRDRAIKEN